MAQTKGWQLNSLFFFGCEACFFFDRWNENPRRVWWPAGLQAADSHIFLCALLQLQGAAARFVWNKHFLFLKSSHNCVCISKDGMWKTDMGTTIWQQFCALHAALQRLSNWQSAKFSFTKYQGTTQDQYTQVFCFYTFLQCFDFLRVSKLAREISPNKCNWQLSFWAKSQS